MNNNRNNQNFLEERENIVSLEHFLERGIVYEVPEKFHESIFHDVYERATRMIEIIVEDTRRECGKEKRKKSYEEYRNDIKKEIEFPNVISFIGRRGTGKSSAMLSFGEALRCYDGEIEGRDFLFHKEADMERVQFLTLPPINASYLEKSENILTLILANMLNQFLKNTEGSQCEEEDSYSHRSILQKLGKLFEDLITIQKEVRQDEYSYYETLRNIGSSQKIRDNFSELIREYLEYILRARKDGRCCQKKESYLVIIIDDLDMGDYNNLENNKVYEIMQSLFRYLNIPRVIVLVAYNYIDLSEQCVSFFRGKSRDVSSEKTIKEKATKYMDKVFSSVFRVYMPSWKKRDYNSAKTKIDITWRPQGGKESGENERYVFDKYIACGKNVLEAKQLVFALYAEIAGLYWDCESKKKHFLEVDTFRDLASTIQLLIYSDNHYRNDFFIPQNNIQKRSIIFKRIKDDLLFRFVDEHLGNVNEREDFAELLDQSLAIRGRSIVRVMCQNTKPLGKQKIKLINKLKAETLLSSEKTFNDTIRNLRDNSAVEYSYAELVHSIYHMTRKTEKIYSKEFVGCILYSYTVYFSDLYYQSREIKEKIGKDAYISGYIKFEDDLETLKFGKDTRKNLEIHEKIKSNPDIYKKMERAKELYDEFESVVGETICGKWTEYYFPEISSESMSNLSLSYSSRTVSVGYIEKQLVAYQLFFDNEKDIELKIKEILFIAMCYVDVLNWNEDIILMEVMRDSQTQVKVSLLDRTGENEHDFELTAFFKYTFLYPRFLNKIRNSLLKSAKKQEIENSIIEKIENVFQKIWEEYCEWDYKYGSTMLPIQSLDITYNMIVRMFQENISRKINPYNFSKLKKGWFFEEFEKMLDKFRWHLKKIDRFYCLENEESFYNIFENCPYISMVKQLQKDETSCKSIERYIKNTILTNAIDRWKDIEDPGDLNN